ncbi:MAG: hypothetical protein ACXIVE_06505 [Salinarimonas sp.]
MASEFFGQRASSRNTLSRSGEARDVPSFRRAAMGFTVSIAALCLAVVLLGSL